MSLFDLETKPLLQRRVRDKTRLGIRGDQILPEKRTRPGPFAINLQEGKKVSAAQKLAGLSPIARHDPGDGSAVATNVPLVLRRHLDHLRPLLDEGLKERRQRGAFPRKKIRTKVDPKIFHDWK